MNMFPDSLAVSLITTVWIGLFVICFFNLRLGWTISGLIVPGYLAPLLILKPWSAVAVIIEAVFTYLVVIAFSKFGEKTGLYSELFGRDRFFFILLISVAIRLLFDEAVFPWLTTILIQHLEIEFLYRDGLYSIGLVIVALTANQFWTSGLRRGIFQLLITLTITFLIIKYILIDFTNFRLNEVASVYENLATSILASPKAYIILLTTAYIASRMNLLYGWEFSGIAIPALLALLWHSPMEILISIVEALIVYFVASLLLRTKFFASMSIEGARKILFFFNVAFLYKFLLGFILPVFFITANPSDYYGFGYMLTSLIAIKMHDKGLGARIIGSTVMTSLISVILATAIGFLLTFTTREYNYAELPAISKTTEFKTSKTPANLPLKLKSGKPAVFGNSHFGKLNSNIKNRKLSFAELKFIDEKLITPLIKLSETTSTTTAFLEKTLTDAAKSADIAGIRMTLFGTRAFQPDLVELRGAVEQGMPATLFISLKNNNNILLESDCHSLASLTLLRFLENELKPKAVLLSALFSRSYEGAIEAEASGKYVKASLFDLSNQIVMRESDNSKDPLNILQIKTAPKGKQIDKKSVYIATDSGSYSAETLNKTQNEIASLLTSKGWTVTFVSGSQKTVGMEIDNLLSARYLEMTSNSSLMVLWVSP